MKVNQIIVGMVFKDKHGEFRVMARADGYAMCRRPRCSPFVKSETELIQQNRQGEIEYVPPKDE